MDKKYVISKHKRSYGYTWSLAVYDNPDTEGRFQHVKTIADFGNTKNTDNYQNAKKVKEIFESWL